MNDQISCERQAVKVTFSVLRKAFYEITIFECLAGG